MSRLDAFLADLAQSGLLPQTRVDLARADLTRGNRDPHSISPVILARELIRRGELTPYQARKLLAGATRGFFLGSYTILRRLGEGGMGKVYLARPTADSQGDLVAIKVLPPERAASEEQALHRFRREMDLSQRVKHPNLAETLDVGRQGGVYFMVLEYVRGRSLYQMVRGGTRGPLRVPDASRYFLGVLSGLGASHKIGLIHRDLKPSNLMVTPEGTAKILDLGLARVLGEDGGLTRPNVVIGTLDYASPEQLGDAARADQRSDLYSIGCTLYFTLAGHPPFEGGDVVNKIFKQRMDDPEPLERVVKGVPSEFAAIVRKLMQKDPADRYQSCEELSHDLSRWTDPAVVRAVLGSTADSAASFRPPPPELDDADLRWIDAQDSTEEGYITPVSSETGADLTKSPRVGTARNLKELGQAEPSVAPMRRVPKPPRTALVVSLNEVEEQESRGESTPDEAKQLLHFIAIVLALGGLALAMLAVFRLRSG